MQRIYVIGSSCAGKTTLARDIAEALGYPHHELDCVCWMPNWTLRPVEQMRERVAELAAGEQWVMCGNWGKVRDLIAERADTIIWLNYPFRIVLWRCLTRTMRRIIDRTPVCNRNYESFRTQFFTRDSIIWFVITSYHRRQRSYRQKFDSGEWNRFEKYEFRHPRQAKRFLEQLMPGAERASRR